jgi:hypothetical protein
MAPALLVFIGWREGRAFHLAALRCAFIAENNCRPREIGRNILPHLKLSPFPALVKFVSKRLDIKSLSGISLDNLRDTQ